MWAGFRNYFTNINMIVNFYAIQGWGVMTNSLPANDLRHGFQLCIQNLTCEMIGGSKEIDISSSQLQRHCWEGRQLGTPSLLSPFLDHRSCTHFIVNGHVQRRIRTKEH